MKVIKTKDNKEIAFPPADTHYNEVVVPKTATELMYTGNAAVVQTMQCERAKVERMYYEQRISPYELERYSPGIIRTGNTSGLLGSIFGSAVDSLSNAYTALSDAYAVNAQQAAGTNAYIEQYARAMTNQAAQAFGNQISNAIGTTEAITVPASAMNARVTYDEMSATYRVLYEAAYAPFAVAQAASKKTLFAQKLKMNLLIRNSRKRSALVAVVAPQEEKARATLRDMISEAEYRRYITNGFIMVKGTRGFHYQVFNDRTRRVKVYKDGKHHSDICIHSDASCPPTDHVINMKVLVELDEDAVWAGGNVSHMGEGWNYRNGLLTLNPANAIAVGA